MQCLVCHSKSKDTKKPSFPSGKDGLREKVSALGVVWRVYRVLAYLCLTEFVRYGQFFAAFGTASSQHASSVRGSHASTESVFIDAFTLRGLERSFHGYGCIFLIDRELRLRFKQMRSKGRKNICYTQDGRR